LSLLYTSVICAAYVVEEAKKSHFLSLFFGELLNWRACPFRSGIAASLV